MVRGNCHIFNPRNFRTVWQNRRTMQYTLQIFTSKNQLGILSLLIIWKHKVNTPTLVEKSLFTFLDIRDFTGSTMSFFVHSHNLIPILRVLNEVWIFLWYDANSILIHFIYALYWCFFYLRLGLSF